MAAGQQKKRLNAASVMRFGFQDNSRGKKTKKLEASNVVLNMSSRISLQWDANQNKAVAKREQVGITWRDMAPFVDPAPQSRSSLADVFSVPQEIFLLESITDLLSYEVWETCLSEQEKKLLIQFLPRAVDVDDVVQSLLAGENVHFGNPVCKWGASLCAGSLHPDAVVDKEQQLRANRNAYFIKLKNYHNGIIERLSRLKERWTYCEDPEDIEEEIVRNGITKPIPLVNPEAAKIFSYFGKEQWHKNDICNDDTEYMSYFKISKKQHQLITNVRHSEDGIQLKSLKHVLRDIKHLKVQPYATFEEEERKRLHEQWSQLANKDIPATFENLEQQRLLVDKWRKSVQHELAGMKRWVDKKDEKESLQSSSSEHIDERNSEEESALNVQDEGCAQSVHHLAHHRYQEIISSPNSCQELSPLSGDKGKDFDILQSSSHLSHPPDNNYHLENSPREYKPFVNQESCGNTVERITTFPALPTLDGCEDSDEDIMELEASPSSDSRLKERSPLGSHERFHPGGEDEGEQDKIRSTGAAPVVWQFLESVNDVGDAEPNAKHSVPWSNENWQRGCIKHPYRHPTSESQAYASNGDLRFQKPQPMEERMAQLIGLEARMHDEENAVSVALHVDHRSSMFNSFANQDCNLLLSPFHREWGTLPSFVQENLDGLNKSEIHFAVSDDSLAQSSQFLGQFLEQQEMLFTQTLSRDKDLYVRQGLSMNMLSSGRFPNKDNFASGGSLGWTSLRTPINGGLPGQDWSHVDNCTAAGWPGAESAGSLGQCLGVTSGIDGNLFGVFSQCPKLLPSSPYVTMNSERSPPGVDFGTRGSPRGDGIYPCPPLLNNGSSRDSTASKVNSMPWTNFSHLYPGLSESFRKSYLASWDH